MIKRYRILHINTDIKFIGPVMNYEDNEIQNDVLFLGDSKGDKRVKFELGLEFSNLEKVVSIANQYDAVVLLDLDKYKSYIANRVRSDLPLFWFFFGYELYGKLPKLMFSKQTLAVMFSNNFSSILKLKFSKAYLLYQMVRHNEFRKAIKRVNFFLGLCQEEYDFLKKYFTLPKFVQRPYKQNKPICSNLQKTGNKIIVGNNRSAFNNHLDILDILERYPDIQKIAFLSYGKTGCYFQKVMEKGQQIENFIPITSFLDRDEFESVYKKADAFVLNGYRQMAVGNIFTAISKGVKLYMSKNNSYYHFLKNQGFFVSEIKDLDHDIENNNITLTSAEIKHNIDSWLNLIEKYNQNDFIKRVKEELFV